MTSLCPSRKQLPCPLSYASEILDQLGMDNLASYLPFKLPANLNPFSSEASQGGAATVERPVAEPTPRFMHGKRKARILVVEDDHGLRSALKERLEHDGCEVTEASDGVSARWSMLSCHYDGVILDLSLPSSSGIEVMTTVARSKALPPIIVLTGGDAADRDGARAAGATFVLKKPSPYSVLADTLDRLLG